MRVTTFNRTSIITKGKPAAAASPPTPGMAALDLGFDDMGDCDRDIMVAPGIVAHFGGVGSAVVEDGLLLGHQRGYAEMPTFERVGDLA